MGAHSELPRVPSDVLRQPQFNSIRACPFGAYFAVSSEKRLINPARLPTILPGHHGSLRKNSLVYD